ncbi:MAG: glycogen debranching protein [Bacteroidota bacterium]
MKILYAGLIVFGRVILWAILLVQFEPGLHAQNTLFTSRAYTVTNDRVIQGKYRAVARSDREIVSSYQSDYKVETPREIQIRFSINGFDNEAPVGQNHILVLNSRSASYTSPLFTFGEFKEGSDPGSARGDSAYLSADTRVTIRVDMRRVISQLKENGYYETSSGQKIHAGEFKGIYVAGNTPPLTWNFQDIPSEPQYSLADPDNDGIYDVTILFKKEFFPGHSDTGDSSWTLKKDLSAFPAYSSSSVLSEALYNKSLEEMTEDLRPDGAFMAGAMWPGVWTRDISYSSLLSLAIIAPDAVKTSLLAKTNNSRIIQDTGTGGSWPVSSDRMIWALAAWEVYKVSGDKEWLQKAYEIVSNSASDDLHTLLDPRTGMFHGESSFLDWREQTYPRWMDPKDIFQSENLGTNAVHYETYQVLAAMASALGESPTRYFQTAEDIKEGVNKYLWIAKKGYYGQYLYGRNFSSLSPRAESLGEALCVIFGIADSSRAYQVIKNTPVTDFGITCIYPQIPDVPPYHNDAIWPFVESYWAWASAMTHNVNSVTRAISSEYRAAAFFLSNKENMVASTGDFMGTQINSSRQLWSVAGNLAIVYRVLFGMTFFPDSLHLAPCIPDGFFGTKTLTNFVYRKSRLTISIEGTGDNVDHVTIDGVRIPGSSVPTTLEGDHVIVVVMRTHTSDHGDVNLVNESFSPKTPDVTVDVTRLNWEPVEGAVSYKLFRNGGAIAELKNEDYEIPSQAEYSEYQVMAIGSDGSESFLSEPVVVDPKVPRVTVQAEDTIGSAEHEHPGLRGSAYVRLSGSSLDSLVYFLDLPVSGDYSIDFRYANGNGPINTDNKCAIRTMEIDNKSFGALVLPQRGDGDWQSWGYSNPINVEMASGKHRLVLYFDKHDNNMNGRVNSALLSSFRLTLLSQY